MYQHREADRVPILDSPWSETIDRWVQEGMPTRDYVAHFGLDKVAHIGGQLPRYERKPSSKPRTTASYYVLGCHAEKLDKTWLHAGVLDFTITDAEKWLEAKRACKWTTPASRGIISRKTTRAGGRRVLDLRRAVVWL